MTDDEILEKAEEIKRRRADELKRKADEVRARVDSLWKFGPVDPAPAFTLDELRFAAGARCKGCGLGLAYPKDAGFGGSWDCSGVLLGDPSVKGGKHDSLPFAFYEVKSEDQPSAYGATTRPKP